MNISGEWLQHAVRALPGSAAGSQTNRSSFATSGRWNAPDASGHFDERRLVEDDTAARPGSVGMPPLRPGDEIRIEGVAAAGENACLDYVEVNPADEKLNGR